MVTLTLTREWVARAACADAPPDLFQPPNGRQDLVRAARSICSACPVAGQCLAAALAYRPAVTGIWAGTTHKDRRAIRHDLARKANTA